MRSARPGKRISEVEVTNVSKHGFWLIIRDREVFLPFDQFPWFKDVPIGKLLNVELPQPHHLYWPDLDVDLAVESIDHPELYPLVSRYQPNAALELTAERAGHRGSNQAPRTPTRRRQRRDQARFFHLKKVPP